MPKTVVVVGLTGASGAAIGVRIVERLRALDGIETHAVVTAAGLKTLQHEVGPDALARLQRLGAVMHDAGEIGASIASGSFPTAGMIVAPCSVRALSAIAAGISSDLVVRAADVHLKERRRLVLMVRETPLHLGHLRSMTAVTEMGAVVMPPVPAFYHRPAGLDDVVDHLATRAIDLLRLPGRELSRAWTGGALDQG
jgi:4-hydroxy-3-polyprenylbenzoate decarboxylase